ncbi:MAG: hypothetical protein BMS9Abin05_1440 [Rhodothermia bacterium]|nr:MAG: hypothetical protein BMS9Abin05_1440 [Rhodothermia bacterium]
MIIFVYNADSGIVNVSMDVAHKLLSPSTYSCRLCQMTYGVLAERRVWKHFRQSTGEDFLFLHRDEFEARFVNRFEYPVILKKSGDKLSVVISQLEMEKMSDVTELIDRLEGVVT